ncbi:aminoglycoside phosphotransferase family protein [Amycolatopsis acidiphila]|uniref:Aminoglycoside phosphotransferase n=1 Tax=Amycolatopsis acidiphila TaxID=715473 RepID=A0A558A062_9PSEU|nr:aminoglycoside phosphotransferase family protein [Amycolatopsis acidiphila]TVT17649.1 aminoglycoside phosphotransferase [Amycolatopsis acidiphila]UIJ60957.1 aminoglycoside phosphotransferase family protein [Amycolatopsis acidiphila]GHG88476.1 aminoglycoside O-phosphotransferase [Amycolatopsis acidiphila]
MRIPTAFAEEIARREGDAGRAWLAELPALAARYCREWQLSPDGEPMHGCLGVVLPVTRADGSPAALKLTRVDAETRGEPVALSTWHGSGSVLLLESAPGVLLLERLDPTRTLAVEPIGAAVEIAARLLRRLAVPAPASIRRLPAARLAEELPAKWRRLGEPIPRRLLDAAVQVCRDSRPGSLLVNEDLHYENVLAGTREPWLVIDPKPVAGDPEFGVIPLLWNRMTESTVDAKFAVIVAAAGLDAGRARAWTLVRGVQNWLRSLEYGGFPGPARLAAITCWAAGSNSL